MENENNKGDEQHKPSPDQNSTPEMPMLDEPILIKDFILMMIASLEAKAWAYLGKIAHPETRKEKSDPIQAKMAIDTIDALYKTLANELSPEEKKELQNRLTNLRLNFAI